MIIRKKAVSPVIATVLLISMVIIIGVIIFLLFRGAIGETILKFGKNVELTCSDVVFDAGYVGGELYVSNNGNVPIYDMKIKFVGSGTHTTGDLSTLSDWAVLGKYGLKQGKTFTGDISSYDGFSSASEIILTPVLYGSSENGDKKAFTCDEKQYGVEVSL